MHKYILSIANATTAVQST